MKFATAIDSIFDRVTKVRLLRRLLIAPERRWTGRELAKAAGVSSAQAARDLHDFSDAGIVLYEVHGRSFVWRLNADNALYPALRQLFLQEAGLRDELLRELSMQLRSSAIRKARLFGSIARGDERPDSDVDVFIEVKNSSGRREIEEVLQKARDRIWKRFGNPLAPLVYTSSRAKQARNPGLMAGIAEDGLDVPGVGET